MDELTEPLDGALVGAEVIAVEGLLGALLDTLIEKVIVRPSTLGSKTGRRFDRSRARIVWRA